MLVTIVGAIIALSVLIMFHEFGHFLFAKLAGIRVENFSLGLGPKIFGIKKGETTYRLSWIPFGGFVKLTGMEPKEVKGEPHEFASKSARVKIGTVIIGPIFNFLLAILIFIITAGIFGTQELPTRTVKSAGHQTELKPFDEIIAINGSQVIAWDDIIEKLSYKDSANCLIKRNNKELQIKIYARTGGFGLEPLILPIVGGLEQNGPAWKAGIREGDLITRINDKEVYDWDTLVSIIRENPGKEISIGWQRAGNYMEANLVPKKEQVLDGNKLKDIGVIGVRIKLIRKPAGLAAFKDGFLKAVGTVAITISFLKQLITGRVSPRMLGGPLAIVKLAGESARWGVENFLTFVAFLSIQLFILNLIPFPPLDGGQILLIGIEKLRKKPVSERGINLIQNIGFALLIMLMVYVTMNDIIRIIK
ncbi:MAG: RIP metalloprotease RseP [bacterium]|nr:RIP metalloprotease RseP [bacterium]